MINKKQKSKQRGVIIVFEIVVIFIFSLVMMAVLGNAAMQYRVLRSSTAKEQAFDIAEAGINYYQWHLAHFPVDFKDGTGAAPTTQSDFGGVACYPHTYIDKDTNQTLGKYCLQITAPLVGSTIVTIKSIGYAASNSSVKRNITTLYGIPSFAKYAFLTNTDVWIGSSETVSGELHANGGIRFDGTGNAPITSSKSTYSCQTYHGCGPTTKAGVWGAAAQATKNFWDYPVGNVDFSSLTSDFATLKSTAQTSGIYLSPSNTQGYSLVFNANSTVSVYKVTSLSSHATGFDVDGNSHPEDLDYNGRTLQFTQAIPSSGVIYVEDRTWVEGTVSARTMVAAAKLPYNAATAPSIIIPNNIVYTAKDGSVSLGLVAQKDVLLSYAAPTNLEIDAAMVAQNGSVQNYYFSGNIKNTITIYGAIASYGIWTWSWVNGSGQTTGGYQNTSTSYDSNLLYAPPPSFPLTSSGYQQITWTSD